MTKRFALIGFIVFYLCTFGSLPYVKAQQYPVQVSTIVNPPYSVFLADYVESGTDRITVSILPTDVNLNNYKVKLKLVIESLDGSVRVETSPYYNPPPVFLQGSVLEMFTSYELYDLFNFNNLVFKGYSRSEYQQTRRLPEGIYRMGIVVLDYNYAVYEQKEVIVSNYGSSTINMFLNDPPMLNLPLTDDKIKLFDPQNIVFQWTPRHRGSPNSAFSAEYIFRLYEVWGQHTDANIIVNTQVPIFETTLSNTRLVYGIAEPLLIPGKYYVWNVQAVEQENRSLFRNNGFSEAFSFKYGDECLAPTQLEGFEIRGPGIQVKWKGGSSVTDYNLQYQTKNNTTWYDENTLLSNISIYDLAIGTIYETRVKANCGTYESPYSKSIEIKTKSTADPVFACGNTQVPLPTNTVPQSSLAVGATFMAGGFTCLITEVNGSNGTFTGKCDVTIPFFNYAKVPHTFSQVKINQLNELISGVLLAEMDTANPIMERIDDVYTDDAENGTADIPLDALLDADTAIVVEGTISEISVDPNTGDIIIVTADGETLVVELDEDDTTAVVTDEDGNEYYVADGVVVTGEAALADATGVSTSETANLDEMRLVLPDIEFAPAELQKYGFDKPIHTELNNSYELIEVRGEPRRIVWKALQTGVSEPVDALIPVSDKYDAQAIGFKTASSRFMSKPTGTQNNKTVNAISVLPGVSETLTAFYSMKDTSGNTVEEELGMLNLIAYDKIIRNVYLVPVNTDVSNTEFEMIKQTLNTTYAQAVSEWSLTLHPRFDVAQSEWDVKPEDGIFQAEDENNRMDYTREQKEIYRAFKSRMDPDKDAWYVFIIPHTTNNTSINGYAIFGKQWVYIYKANAGNNMAHTITHELGHAAFSLRHTFSEQNEYIVTQNSTQNLMDYAGGTELNKYQWDLIHDPESTFAFLQDESEGQYTWTPVNEQFAQLFNHVYDYNHIGELKYTTAIETAIAAGNTDALGLSYTTDETEDWSETQKIWIDQWKIRSMNSEEVFNDVIKAIKDAGNEEKISKIVLRPKHIYIGKYKYEDVEYPVAIYGNGDKAVMTDAFTKIQVTDAGELDDKEKKKSIYCDETYTKYLIIAFYEDGKTDPSMIMQVEKFTGDDSKDKWLKYLGILNEVVKEKVDTNILPKEIVIQYQRKGRNTYRTWGTFTIQGTDYSGYILERPKGDNPSRLEDYRRHPAGTYTIGYSEDAGGNRIEFYDVTLYIVEHPGYKLHGGNRADDSDGCLLINYFSPQNDSYPRANKFTNPDAAPKNRVKRTDKIGVVNTYYQHNDSNNPAKKLRDKVYNLEQEIKKEYQVKTVVKKIIIDESLEKVEP